MKKEELLKLSEQVDNPLIGTGENSIRSDSTKVFISRKNRLIFAALKPRAVHLFFWLAANCLKDCDLIHIDRHSYMKESSISRQETYMNAIADLVMAKILYRYPLYTDLYFVNPHIFFKGNRLFKYRALLKPEKIKNAEYLNKNKK